MSQYDYHSYQLKKTKKALKFIFTRLGLPLNFFYWFTLDLFYHPEIKWKLLGIRFFMIPIAVFSYGLFKHRFFQKYFLLPVFIGSFLTSIMSGVLLLEYVDVAHSLSFLQNLIATASLVFLPMPIWAMIVQLVIIYVPYLIVVVLSHPESSLLQIYSNLNSFAGFIALIVCVRYFHSKRDREDFENQQKLMADAEIGENISQISHDTRAPLLALQTLQGGYFDEAQSKNILRESVGRLIELVEDITQSASSLHMNIQPVDLRSFFKECREYTEFLHPSKTFLWELVLEVGVYAFDKNKIKRVLINLINNAVTAAASKPEEPIIIKCNCSQRLLVTVLDAGAGFDSNDIFEKGISKFGSSGLGLYFCKQVILAHGGEITGLHENGLTKFNFVI